MNAALLTKATSCDNVGPTALAPTDVQVSVVLPCLNEAGTLRACVVEAQDALSGRGLCGEIVVADNGSTDGSAEIAERMGRGSCMSRPEATAPPCARASPRRGAAPLAESCQAQDRPVAERATTQAGEGGSR